MQEIVRSIISLIADGKIEIGQDFMRSLIREFLRNDFKIPYSRIQMIDVMDYTDIMKLLEWDRSNTEEYRTKVANILALLNISKVTGLME